MGKLFVPSPLKFETATNYFMEFVKVNKSTKPFFSFRYFAQKLNWPNSYLPDLSKGRKPLSIKRAQEFSEYFKFNRLEQERLVWFALAASADETSRNFFERKLKLTPEQVLKPQVVVVDIEEHHLVRSIFILLKCTRRKMTAEEIQNEFEIGGFSLEEIARGLKVIEENKLLEWNEQGRLTKINGDIGSTDNFGDRDEKPFMGIELHRHFAQNFLEFIKNPKSPSTYNTGFIELKKGQFMSVALQILELRNWINEMSEQNQSEVNPTEERRLMQLNLDFFALKK